MEDLKTIEDILKQKSEMEAEIKSIVEAFLRLNPEVRDIDFTKEIYVHETKCKEYKEFLFRIDLKL